MLTIFEKDYISRYVAWVINSLDLTHHCSNNVTHRQWFIKQGNTTISVANWVNNIFPKATWKQIPQLLWSNLSQISNRGLVNTHELRFYFSRYSTETDSQFFKAYVKELNRHLLMDKWIYFQLIPHTLKVSKLYWLLKTPQQCLYKHQISSLIWKGLMTINLTLDQHQVKFHFNTYAH